MRSFFLAFSNSSLVKAPDLYKSFKSFNCWLMLSFVFFLDFFVILLSFFSILVVVLVVPPKKPSSVNFALTSESLHLLLNLDSLPFPGLIPFFHFTYLPFANILQFYQAG